MQQQQLNHYNCCLSFGSITQSNTQITINYNQTEQSLDEYKIILKMKVKQGIDIKIADAEFKDRCKSCYIILTGFVKQIKDFLKPTFNLSYSVDENYANIIFRYSSVQEAQEFIEICKFIKENAERSQTQEEILIQLNTDLSFDSLSKDISKAIQNMNISINFNAQLHKNTFQLFNTLSEIIDDQLPNPLKNIHLKQILTQLHMLINLNAQIQFNKLEYNIGIQHPKIELPFKFAIYSKLQRFAEQYLDNSAKIEIEGPGLSFSCELKYSGSLFTLIDNILIIK